MPRGEVVRVLGRDRKDFEPTERVVANGRAGEFYGYAYGEEWDTALVVFDGETEETCVPLRDLRAASL